MRYIVLSLVYCLFLSMLGFSGEVKVRLNGKTKVKVVDGDVVIYGDNRSPRVAYPHQPLSAYKVGNYSVREIESRDDVQEALKVYKSKGIKIKERKVLIYDRQTGNRTLITSYSCGDGRSYYLLPDGDVIYVDLRNGVPSLLYRNLGSGRERPVFYGLTYWDFVPCEDSVVVIVNDDEGRKYLLWSKQEFHSVDEEFLSSCDNGGRR